MKLKYMYLKNFRQFKGENKILFSEDVDKNITVVVGKNTSGKTTLLQSFLWCLYDKANFENYNLLNFKLMEEMKLGDKLEVFVEISLLSEETEYIIKRKCYFNKETNGINTDNSYLDIHYKQDDGQLNRIKTHKTVSKINEILPEELSDYFFFDTERIQNISLKKNIKEAVKNLLGLTVLDNAINHIGNKNKKTSVIGKLYGNLDLENQIEANTIEKNIDRFRQDIEKINGKIKNVNDEIEYYSNEVGKYNDILLSNYETKKLQEKRNKLENKINSNRRSIENYEENIMRNLNDGLADFLLKPIAKKCIEMIDNAEIDDRGIKNVNKDTIEDIIKKGKCICGNKIDKDSEEYKYLIESLEYLPPRSIGTLVREFKSRLNYNMKRESILFKNIDNFYDDIIFKREEIGDLLDEINDIKNKIDGTQNMSAIERKRDNASSELKKNERNKNSYLVEKEKKESDIEGLKKKKEKLIEKNKKNLEIVTYIKYSQILSEWLIENYGKRENQIRKQLETSVNDIFMKLYHGERGVKINNDYYVELLTHEISDQNSGESEGLKTIKNFSFIGGLVNLAKNKIYNGDATDYLTNEAVPLVMDAPFSNTDTIHVENIAKVLPEVAEQIIMFVMEKDFNLAREKMNNKIGKMYHINKIDEIESSIKEA